MGAKVSTIWHIDAADPKAILRSDPQPDWNAATSLVGRLLPGFDAVPTQVVPLGSAAGVEPGHIFVGCYPGVTVVCTTELAGMTPSTLSNTWPGADQVERAECTYLVASDPSNAWGAFALWERGELRRSFSATPIYIHEDDGIPLVWELPFWAGEHPLAYPDGVMPDPQSLPFHPQQFAEAANLEWLGFRYTGAPHDGELDPKQLPVCGFALYPAGQAPRPEPPEIPHTNGNHAAESPSTPEPPKNGKIRRWLGLEKKV